VTVSLGLIIEIAVNLIQQLMFIGFLFLFFDKGDNKVKNILAFSISTLLLFTMANYFTFNEMTLNHLDSIITIIVMLVYTICFLKGELYLRILMPIIVFGLNMLISYINIFIMSSFGDVPFEEAISFSTSFRYLYLLVTNLLYLFALFIIYRIGKKKIQVVGKVEIIAFIIVAAALYVGALSTMLIDKQLVKNNEIFPYVSVVFVSMFFSAGLFWFLLIKVSRDNQIKSDLLLSKQREEMYQNSVITSNGYIEKTIEIKHDIKNHILTINNLIANGEYDDAQTLCNTLTEELNGAAPVHTSNSVLNAIVNVEFEKAQSQHIDFTYEINDSISFIKDADVVSVIGNLCDNAIEYLSTLSEHLRKMTLNIDSHKNFYYISCKNSIEQSILSNNPSLITSKENRDLHGKGLNILKRIAKKYDGDVHIKEENKMLITSVIIRKPDQ